MPEKIFFHLLIFCGIFSQIIRALSDDNIRESSDFLLRKKRVINLEENGQRPTRIEEVPYIVNIKHGFLTTCVGSILSHYTVITSATCFNDNHFSSYHILSGSGYPHRSIPHNITSLSQNTASRNPFGSHDVIALLTVDPLFTYSGKTFSISLYVGPIAPGTEVSVTGWGCYHPTAPHVTNTSQRRLRKITLPIMNHDNCKNVYFDKFPITTKHLCTHDPRKMCAFSDIGAPLVINNMLAGVHIYKGTFPNQTNPDVYVNLQYPELPHWIREHTILI